MKNDPSILFPRTRREKLLLQLFHLDQAKASLASAIKLGGLSDKSDDDIFEALRQISARRYRVWGELRRIEREQNG
jgi:hypothetical protein